jgi:thiamine biosynthesis protein ThiC
VRTSIQYGKCKFNGVLSAFRGAAVARLLCYITPQARLARPRGKA